MMDSDTEIKSAVKPKWAIYKTDDTEYWFCGPQYADIKAAAGRIFSVYLFDRNLHVYCCSMTPAHEMHFVRSEWEGVEGREYSDEEREHIEDTINEDDIHAEPVSYVNAYRFGNIGPIIGGGFPDGSRGVIELPHLDGEDFDSALDDVNGNWV